MTTRKLKKAVGNWVEGDQFWDRKPELELFIGELEAGSNLSLVAPRRIGKTSLMREAARRIAHRFTCLHVDLQKSQTPADAVVELSLATQPHQKVWKKIPAIFGNLLDRVSQRVEKVSAKDINITLRSGINAGNWQEKGDRLFDVLASADKPVIVFFDEVSILVNRLLKGTDYRITPERKKEADAFVSWLRHNAGKHQGKIRQVLTGSIGLQPILRQAGLSATLNMHAHFELGPWPPPIAVECLQALANEYRLQFRPGVPEHMIDRIGYCIPHHVQMFFNTVHTARTLENLSEITMETVNRLYETKMLGDYGKKELTHFEERLTTVLGPEISPAAFAYLTETARIGSLTKEAATALLSGVSFGERPQTDVMREISDILEHDGYLHRADGSIYTFVSRFLKDWWQKHGPDMVAPDGRN